MTMPTIPDLSDFHQKDGNGDLVMDDDGNPIFVEFITPETEGRVIQRVIMGSDEATRVIPLFDEWQTTVQQDYCRDCIKVRDHNISEASKTSPNYKQYPERPEAILYSDWKSTNYEFFRRYPSVGEQLDYIYHNGLDAWKTDIINPIKAAHPKP